MAKETFIANVLDYQTCLRLTIAANVAEVLKLRPKQKVRVTIETLEEE